MPAMHATDRPARGGLKAWSALRWRLILAGLLAAMKRVLGPKLTTVFVRQGHYAAQSANTLIDPPPDLEIERIGDLLDHDAADFLAASPFGVAATNEERT